MTIDEDLRYFLLALDCFRQSAHLRDLAVYQDAAVREAVWHDAKRSDALGDEYLADCEVGQ